MHVQTHMRPSKHTHTHKHAYTGTRAFLLLIWDSEVLEDMFDVLQDKLNERQEHRLRG